MQSFVFLKIYFSLKCSFSEKADAVQMYLLQRSSSLLDIAILNSSSEKKNPALKSTCFLEVSLWKRNYSKKRTPAKKWLFWKRRKSSCSEEISAPKKYLLCQSSYFEKVWRSIFSQNKIVLNKWQHIREGKSRFEKKKKPN